MATADPDPQPATPVSATPTAGTDAWPPEGGPVTLGSAIRLVSGLIAVATGIAAVVVISVVALHRNTQIAATIAGAAGGVIASIVGAYFGVKIGSDQTRAAITGQREEAAKAQVFAAHLDPAKAEGALAEALRAAEAVRPPEPGPRKPRPRRRVQRKPQPQ